MPITKFDGCEIHYTLCGPEQPQQKLLYVHGTGCNASVWDRHCATLSDRHQCVAIDLPGHGRSGGLGYRGAADYAHFVQVLAEHLGWDRYVLIGHSLGGDEDPITPVRNHVHFHTHMPRCDLEVIEECGHWPAYEKPRQFDGIVARFVNQLQRK